MGSLETFLLRCASELTRGWECPQVLPGDLRRAAKEPTVGHLSNGHHVGSPAHVLPSFSELESSPTETLADSPLLCKHFFPQRSFEGKRLVMGRVHVFALVLPNFHSISCHCWGVPLLGPNSQG